MNINRNDLQALAATYQTICEASDIQHSDQGAYQDAAGGARTSTYKTVQPGMGKGMGKETSHNGGMNATEQYDEMKRKLDAGEITEEVWMRFCQDMLADILKGTGVEADDFKYL